MGADFKKININGGEILGFILFSSVAVYLDGYIRYFFIPPALTCLFALINNLKKNKSELIKYLYYLSGALCASGAGMFLYTDYWNNGALLIAKIGFLIIVGILFLISIAGTIISLYLIINYFIKKRR